MSLIIYTFIHVGNGYPHFIPFASFGSGRVCVYIGGGLCVSDGQPLSVLTSAASPGWMLVFFQGGGRYAPLLEMFAPASQWCGIACTASTCLLFIIITSVNLALQPQVLQ